MQQTSTFLWDSVSTGSQTLPLRVFTLSVPTLNFIRCLLDSPQCPDPASHTWKEVKLETLPTELWCLLAPPNSESILVLTMKDFGTTVFTGSPVLADIPTQFFYSIWAYTPFPHSGSVLCRCPYKKQIVCQTTIARTPSHRSVDDCCLALPHRLWQSRNPEGGEATVIEGSLTFPHSCWVSQLDAVLRHTQDPTVLYPTTRWWGMVGYYGFTLVGHPFIHQLYIRGSVFFIFWCLDCWGTNFTNFWLCYLPAPQLWWGIIVPHFYYPKYLDTLTPYHILRFEHFIPWWVKKLPNVWQIV